MNPNQSSQPDPSKSSAANVSHYLFDYSFPEGLIEAAAIVPPPSNPVTVELPCLPDSLLANLPDFLKKVVARCSIKEDRDMLLLGALVSLSACLPKMHGYYDSHKIYPNLFLYITGQSTESMGRLLLCKHLVLPVHNALMEQGQLMKQQLKIDKKTYKNFPEKGLLIPANSSRPGVFKRLADNDGQGLIIETEGDIITKALKAKVPNFNIGLRKGFHHETISYYALSREGYVEIDEPCISVLLSGNFKQLSSLIPFATHGLFSRFMFYFVSNGTPWENVFPSEIDPALEQHFDELGQEFLTLYEALNQQADITFNYTKDQQKEFNYFFSLLHDKYGVIQNSGLIATIRRLGLIAYRISMILSALRMLETSDFLPEKKCQDVDLQASLSIIRVLFRHASYAYSKLPYEEEFARKRG